MSEQTRDQIIEKIVSIELRMFLAVETPDQMPAACQEQPDTLKLMRRASHCALSDETIKSYLNDVQEALDEDRNLMTLKYARMDNLIPVLNTNPLIEKIIEIESDWLKELAERYPLTFKGQSEYSANVYLRCELETYSDHTLELYYKDVTTAQNENRNLTADRFTFMFQQSGYNSIDEMEDMLKKAG